MIKTITQMPIDGYGSGETDFPARLGLSDQQVKLDFETEIIQSQRSGRYRGPDARAAAAAGIRSE
jgi:hypothetical protein